MHVNPLLAVRTTRRDAATFLVLLIMACSMKKTPLTADRKMCPHLGRDVPVLASHFGQGSHRISLLHPMLDCSGASKSYTVPCRARGEEGLTPRPSTSRPGV